MCTWQVKKSPHLGDEGNGSWVNHELVRLTLESNIWVIHVMHFYASLVLFSYVWNGWIYVRYVHLNSCWIMIKYCLAEQNALSAISLPGWLSLHQDTAWFGLEEGCDLSQHTTTYTSFKALLSWLLWCLVVLTKYMSIYWPRLTAKISSYSWKI